MASTLVLIYFGRPLLGHTIKTNFIEFQIVDPEQYWILFFIRGSGTTFSTTFCARFFKKLFAMLYYINWPNFIVWLPFLLEILDNICIVIICCPVCDAINFEINHSFLIKPIFYIKKKLGQKCKDLKNEKSF